MKIFHILILIILLVVVGCQEENGFNENEAVEEEEVVVLFVNGVPITEEDVFQIQMRKLYEKLMDEVEVTEEDIKERYVLYEEEFEEEERKTVKYDYMPNM